MNLVNDVSVELIDHCGTDLSVVNAARVSFEKESEWVYSDDNSFDSFLSQSDTKLIGYLAKHKHFSPFNHCFLSFRIKAPVIVARQLVKHKFMPWNEVSRRYVSSEPSFYMPETWRQKAENVKQGSSEVAVVQGLMRGFSEVSVTDVVSRYYDYAITLYEDMLDAGVCPEQARMILPQSMMTEWVWSGTLGAVADMCKLRLDPHTQKESRDVAKQVARVTQELFPISFNALLINK